MLKCFPACHASLWVPYGCLRPSSVPFLLFLQRADFSRPESLRRSLGESIVPPPGKTPAGSTVLASLHPSQHAAESPSESSRSPVVVRRENGEIKLPGFFGAMSARTCLVTNWAGFYQELCLTGNTVQTWHVPLFCDDRTTLSDIFVIFRPRGDETSILAFSRNIDFADAGMQSQ